MRGGRFQPEADPDDPTTHTSTEPTNPTPSMSIHPEDVLSARPRESSGVQVLGAVGVHVGVEDGT